MGECVFINSKLPLLSIPHTVGYRIDIIQSRSSIRSGIEQECIPLYTFVKGEQDLFVLQTGSDLHTLARIRENVGILPLFFVAY